MRPGPEPAQPEGVTDLLVALTPAEAFQKSVQQYHEGGAKACRAMIQ